MVVMAAVTIAVSWIELVAFVSVSLESHVFLQIDLDIGLQDVPSESPESFRFSVYLLFCYVLVC